MAALESINVTRAAESLLCYRNVKQRHLVNESSYNSCRSPCATRNYIVSSFWRAVSKAKILKYYKSKRITERLQEEEHDRDSTLSMLGDIFSDLTDIIFKNNDKVVFQTPRYAFPPLNITNMALGQELNMNYLVIRVHSSVERVRVFKEKLIHTFWSMVAQSGGACSFYAGVTFTVIAELIDSIYSYLTRDREQRLEMKETRITSFNSS